MGSLSQLLGVVSLLGFVGFLAGIGLVVVNASQGRPVRGGVMMALFGILVGLLFTVISQGIVIVQPTERGVVFNVVDGTLQEPPLEPGTHIVIPILQEVTIYPVSQQEYTMSDVAAEGRVQGQDAVVARTKDGQEVRLDVTVLYGLDPAQVNEVHKRWQKNYEEKLVRPLARNLVRTVVAGYQAAEIYGEPGATTTATDQFPTESGLTRGRAEMEAEITATVKEEFAKEGIILTGLLIRAINFSDEFSIAIENKVIELQKLDQAKIEAERVQTQAMGEANAKIEQARGDAQAIIAKAEAQAKALELISAQIAANPSLIQYQYIQNLSDNVSLILVPTNSPFLFDMASLADANPNLVVPDVLPGDTATTDTSGDTTGSGGN
jgi:prohibitin 2